MEGVKTTIMDIVPELRRATDEDDQGMGELHLVYSKNTCTDVACVISAWHSNEFMSGWWGGVLSVYAPLVKFLQPAGSVCAHMCCCLAQELVQAVAALHEVASPIACHRV